MTDEQMKWFLKNYSELGGVQCSKILGIDRKILAGIAWRNDIQVSGHVKTQNRRFQALNEREKIISGSHHLSFNMPEQVYSLGFLWGDGYLATFKSVCGETYYPRITLKQDDFNEVLPLFATLCDWGHCKKIQKSNGKIAINAYSGNNTLGHFLKMNDYIEKSHICPQKILSNIPDDLYYDWLRGYIDADGCFYSNKTVNQFVLAGSYEQDWSEIERIFDKCNIRGYQTKRVISNKNHRYSQLRINSKYEILKLGNYIYPNGFSFGLRRKYEKYRTIIEKLNPALYAKHQI